MTAFFDTQKERWVAIAGGPPCPVTLEQFVSHVKKFGSECVVETALELGLHQRDLLRLRVECDAFEAKRKWVGKRRRRSPQESFSAVVELRKDGLVPAAIADRLGVTETHVRRLLKGVSDLENTGRKRFIHAADSVLKSEPGLSYV